MLSQVLNLQVPGIRTGKVCMFHHVRGHCESLDVSTPQGRTGQTFPDCTSLPVRLFRLWIPHGRDYPWKSLWYKSGMCCISPSFKFRSAYSERVGVLNMGLSWFGSLNWTSNFLCVPVSRSDWRVTLIRFTPCKLPCFPPLWRPNRLCISVVYVIDPTQT